VNLKAPFGIEGYSLTCKILCNSGYLRYLNAGKRPSDKKEDEKRTKKRKSHKAATK
jgi:hypothetical protein